MLMLTMVATPGSWTAVAGEPDDELEIQVQVVPGPTPTPELAPWPGRVPPEVMPGTVSASLSAAPSNALAESGRNRFDLVVLDQRMHAPGWVVTVSQVQGLDTAPMILDRFLRRTVAMGDQPVPVDQMPHGRRLSVGQSLDQPVPVINAKPGTGTGAYWIRFSVAGVRDEPTLVHILVVSTTSAP